MNACGRAQIAAFLSPGTGSSTSVVRARRRAAARRRTARPVRSRRPGSRRAARRTRRTMRPSRRATARIRVVAGTSNGTTTLAGEQVGHRQFGRVDLPLDRLFPGRVLLVADRSAVRPPGSRHRRRISTVRACTCRNRSRTRSVAPAAARTGTRVRDQDARRSRRSRPAARARRTATASGSCRTTPGTGRAGSPRTARRRRPAVASVEQVGHVGSPPTTSDVMTSSQVARPRAALYRSSVSSVSRSQPQPAARPGSTRPSGPATPSTGRPVPSPPDATAPARPRIPVVGPCRTRCR